MLHRQTLRYFTYPNIWVFQTLFLKCLQALFLLIFCLINCSNYSSSILSGVGYMIPYPLSLNVDYISCYFLFTAFNLDIVICSASVFGVSTESMQLSYDTRGNSVPTILLLMQRHLYAQGGLQVCLYYIFVIIHLIIIVIIINSLPSMATYDLLCNMHQSFE